MRAARALANVSALMLSRAPLAGSSPSGLSTGVSPADQHASIAKAFTTARMRETVAWADDKIGKGVRGYLLASARHDPRLRPAHRDHASERGGLR